MSDPISQREYEDGLRRLLAKFIADSQAVVTSASVTVQQSADNGAAAALAAHVAAVDPHPQYLTEPEADLLYAPLGGGGGLPWFNVVSYGATGDGTTDDTAAVTAAIAALTTAGRGVLYFPAGRYSTTGGFTLSVPCEVRGDGAEAFDGSEIVTRVICTSSTAVLFTVSTDQARFSDLALACTAATPSAGSAVLVDSSYIHQRCDFENITVRGFYDNLDVKVGAHWSLRSSLILDPVRYGVRIRNTVNLDAGDWSISETHFNPLTRNATAAIRLESGGGGKVINSKVNCSAPPGTFKFTDGISMAKASGTSTSILLIANTSIENYTGDGIDLTGPDWNMVHIVNCQFGQYSNSTGSAIKIASLNDIHIVGCHFRATSGTPTAISLTSVSRARIGAITNNGFGTRLAQSSVTDLIDLDAGGDPTLGGDLSGTASAATVDGLQGRAVASTAPATGDRLRYDGTQWAPSAARWEPLTNGDAASPELLFVAGDVIMVEVS